MEEREWMNEKEETIMEKRETRIEEEIGGQGMEGENGGKIMEERLWR